MWQRTGKFAHHVCGGHAPENGGEQQDQNAASVAGAVNDVLCAIGAARDHAECRGHQGPQAEVCDAFRGGLFGWKIRWFQFLTRTPLRAPTWLSQAYPPAALAPNMRRIMARCCNEKANREEMRVKTELVLTIRTGDRRPLHAGVAKALPRMTPRRPAWAFARAERVHSTSSSCSTTSAIKIDDAVQAHTIASAVCALWM